MNLCQKGRFTKIAFLSSANFPGKVKKVVDFDELTENGRDTFNDGIGNFGEYKLYKAN